MLLMLGASEEAFMEHCIGASAEACHLNLSDVEILGGFSRCRSVACLYELIFLGSLQTLAFWFMGHLFVLIVLLLSSYFLPLCLDKGWGIC